MFCYFSNNIVEAEGVRMTKVSVITPIYNSEKYLEQCISSLKEQTLDDIEIILIDDGSTDRSASICDCYADSCSKIKVIHKQNEGMGKTYNLGIDIAEGEYIGFVESDDFADKHMFEDLYELAKKYDVDIAKGAYFKYSTKDDRRIKDLEFANFNSYEIININNAPELVISHATLWSGIYRKSFIKDNGIRYNETPSAAFQDVAFTHKVMMLAKNIVITPNAYLYYRIDNENSSIHSKDRANSMYEEYEELDRFLLEHPDIKSKINNIKLVKQFGDCMWNYERIADEYKPDFLKKVAYKFSEYKNNGELGVKFYTNVDTRIFNIMMNLISD